MNYIDGPTLELNSPDELMTVDWVNSLDIPSCTLVDDIHDLKSGCVVADIVTWLFPVSLSPIRRDIRSRSDAIANWRVLLDSLSSLLPKPLLARPEAFLDVRLT
jgi:hypothetical protein